MTRINSDADETKLYQYTNTSEVKTERRHLQKKKKKIKFQIDLDLKFSSNILDLCSVQNVLKNIHVLVSHHRETPQLFNCYSNKSRHSNQYTTT